MLHTDDDGVVTIWVTVIKHIKGGEEVFISYIQDLKRTLAERQEELQYLLGCDCQCKRCKRESGESNDGEDEEDEEEDDDVDDDDDSEDEGEDVYDGIVRGQYGPRETTPEWQRR